MDGETLRLECNCICHCKMLMYDLKKEKFIKSWQSFKLSSCFNGFLFVFFLISSKNYTNAYRRAYRMRWNSIVIEYLRRLGHKNRFHVPSDYSYHRPRREIVPFCMHFLHPSIKILQRKKLFSRFTSAILIQMVTFTVTAIFR